MSEVETAGGGSYVRGEPLSRLQKALAAYHMRDAADAFLELWKVEPDRAVNEVPDGLLSRGWLWAALKVHNGSDPNLDAVQKALYPNINAIPHQDALAMIEKGYTGANDDQGRQFLVPALETIGQRNTTDARSLLKALVRRATSEQRLSALKSRLIEPINSPGVTYNGVDANALILLRQLFWDGEPEQPVQDWWARLGWFGDTRLNTIFRQEVEQPRWPDARLTAPLLSNYGLGEVLYAVTQPQRKAFLEAIAEPRFESLRQRCQEGMDYYLQEEERRLSISTKEIRDKLLRGDFQAAAKQAATLQKAQLERWFALVSVHDLSLLLYGELGASGVNEADMPWLAPGSSKLLPPVRGRSDSAQALVWALLRAIKAADEALRAFEPASADKLKTLIDALLRLELTSAGVARKLLLAWRWNSTVQEKIFQLLTATGPTALPTSFDGFMLSRVLQEADLGRDWGLRFYYLGRPEMLTEVAHTELVGDWEELARTSHLLSELDLGKLLRLLAEGEQARLKTTLVSLGLGDGVDARFERARKAAAGLQPFPKIQGPLSQGKWKEAAGQTKKLEEARWKELAAVLGPEQWAGLLLGVRGLEGEFFFPAPDEETTRLLEGLRDAHITKGYTLSLAQGFFAACKAAEWANKALPPCTLREEEKHLMVGWLLQAPALAGDYLRWFLRLELNHNPQIHRLLHLLEVNNDDVRVVRPDWLQVLGDGYEGWARRAVYLGSPLLKDLFYELAGWDPTGKDDEQKDRWPEVELEVITGSLRGALVTLNGLGDPDRKSVLKSLSVTRLTELLNALDAGVPAWCLWLRGPVQAARSDKVTDNPALVKARLRSGDWDGATDLFFKLTDEEAQALDLVTGTLTSAAGDADLQKLFLAWTLRKVGNASKGKTMPRSLGNARYLLKPLAAHDDPAGLCRDLWLCQLFGEFAPGLLKDAYPGRAQSAQRLNNAIQLGLALPGPTPPMGTSDVFSHSLANGVAMLAALPEAASHQERLAVMQEALPKGDEQFCGHPPRLALLLLLIRQLVCKEPLVPSPVGAWALMGALELSPEEHPWPNASPELITLLGIQDDAFAVKRFLFYGTPRLLTLAQEQAAGLNVVDFEGNYFKGLVTALFRTIRGLNDDHLKEFLRTQSSDIREALRAEAQRREPSWQQLKDAQFWEGPRTTWVNLDDISGGISLQLVGSVARVRKYKIPMESVNQKLKKAGPLKYFKFDPTELEFTFNVSGATPTPDTEATFTRSLDEGFKAEAKREYEIFSTQLFAGIKISVKHQSEAQLMKGDHKLKLGVAVEASWDRIIGGMITNPKVSLSGGLELELSKALEGELGSLANLPICATFEADLGKSVTDFLTHYSIALVPGFESCTLSLKTKVKFTFKIDWEVVVLELSQAAAKRVPPAAVVLAVILFAVECQQMIQYLANQSLLIDMLRGWGNMAEDAYWAGFQKGLGLSDVQEPSLGTVDARVTRYEPEFKTEMTVWEQIRGVAMDPRYKLAWLGQITHIKAQMLLTGQKQASSLVRDLAGELRTKLALQQDTATLEAALNQVSTSIPKVRGVESIAQELHTLLREQNPIPSLEKGLRPRLSLFSRQSVWAALARAGKGSSIPAQIVLQPQWKSALGVTSDEAPSLEKWRQSLRTIVSANGATLSKDLQDVIPLGWNDWHAPMKAPSP